MAPTSNIGKAVLIISTETGEFTRGIDGVNRKVQDLIGGSSSLRGVIGQLGPSLAGAFSIAAVGAFAKEVLDLGGHLVDMHDQTDISVESLQILGRAADLAGGNMDQVTRAVSQLQKRIASGDDSLISVLSGLGVSFQQFEAMSADQQFMTIARAVREATDQTERVRIATGAFGKLGTELLPLLVSDIDAVAAATRTMSTRSAESLDWLGDKWTELWGNVKGASGDVLANVVDTFSSADRILEASLIGMGNRAAMMRKDLRDTTADVKQFAEGFKEIKPAIADAFQLPSGGIDAALAKFKEMEERQKKAAAEAKKHSEEQKRVNDQLFKSIQAAEQAKTTVWDPGPPRTLQEALRGVGDTWNDLNESIIKTTYGLEANTDGLRAFKDEIVDVYTEMERLGYVENNYFDFGPVLDESSAAAGRTKFTLTDLFTNIPAGMGVLQDKVGKSLLGMFGASQNSLLGGIMNSGLSMVFGPLTGLMSQWAMKGLEALGGIVLKGLKKIGGYFKDLFGGPDAKELAGREVVDQFQSNLAEALEPAKRTGEQWKDTVIAIRDRYIELGLTEAEALRDAERLWASSKAGPEASKAVIAEIEQKMKGVAAAAREAGDAVAESFGDSFSQSEEDAIKFAERQKNALAEMAKSGQFSAEEIEAAQIRAAESIRLVFDDLAARGFDIPVRFNVGDLVTPGGPVVPMADGGIGRVYGPTLFMAGEDGAEDFAFSGGGRRFGPPAGGGGTAVLMLNDRVLAEAVVPQMPGVVRRYGLK